MKKVMPFILLLLALSVYAETTGNITFQYFNATTGLFGYTVNVCNATADCHGSPLTCLQDYDSVSESPSTGWCNATTNCFHDGYTFATNQKSCVSLTTFRQCSSGTWGGIGNCSSGYTCTTASIYPGDCLTNSSGSGSGSGGGGSNLTSTVNPAITVTVPSDFDIVQGTEQTKTVVVKNTGNKTLNNVTLTLSGAGWYTVSPSKISSIIKNAEASFSVVFSPPEDTAAASYQITVTVSSAEISTSKTFTIKVNLSEKSGQEQVIPDLNNYTAQLDLVEDEITELEKRGANVTKVRELFISAQSKLADAKILAEVKDYTSAARLIDEAKGLIDQISARLSELDEETKFKLDPIWIVYAIVVIGIIVFVRYLLLPPKEEKKKTMYELLADQENTIVEKIKRRVQNERKNKKK